MRFLVEKLVSCWKILYNSKKIGKKEYKKDKKKENRKFIRMKMITELRQKSQITIPKGIVTKLSLREGDKLEIYEKDGEIHIVPVDVYPIGYIEGLKKEIERLRKEVR